jgi:hypothetical protein
MAMDGLSDVTICPAMRIRVNAAAKWRKRPNLMGLAGTVNGPLPGHPEKSALGKEVEAPASPERLHRRGKT